MKKYSFFILMLLTIAVLVTGCGKPSLDAYLADNYPLIDARQSRYNGDDAAYVFKLDKKVSKAAQEISALYKPNNMTEKSNDERMLLVYPDYILDIFSEENYTFAEISTKQYVRDHYNSSGFFRGYLTATIVRDIFSGPRSWGYGTYQPYSTRKTVSDYGKSVREGSVGSKTVKGGGLFGGK